MTFLRFSAVPGMTVPGMGVPAEDGTTGTGTYLYVGQLPVVFLDYLDTATQRTLSVTPGGRYSMVAVNSRAGLSIPPPGHVGHDPGMFSA